MTKITGTKSFNNNEKALKFYNKLDKIGYNVALVCHPTNTYTVSYEGYTEKIPMEKIMK